LEGLDACELLFSAAGEGNEVFRFDAEYFGKEAVQVIAQLHKANPQNLASLAFITDGIHTSLPFCDDGEIKVLSAKHPKENFVDRSQFETVSAAFHAKNPRTALRENDVLISTVGTIGNAAVVTADLLPANSDRHIGILRLTDPSLSPYYVSTCLLTRYGRIQSMRETTGNVQPNLFISKIGKIFIPRFSGVFEKQIAQHVESAYRLRETAKTQLKAAEISLIRALGLENWQAPEPLTYVRRSGDAFAAGRLDAEHFQEKFYAAKEILLSVGAKRFIPLPELLTTLTNGQTPLHHNLTIGEVPFLCAEHVTDFNLCFESEKRILSVHHEKELARTAVRDGDILLTIKGRIGNAAIAENVPGPININQDVGLLRFNDALPLWYVVAYLNSRFGKLQSEKMATGAINPFLGLFSIRQFEIPEFDADWMQSVGEVTRKHVAAAREAKQRATQLLDAAKRAVEIAIEDGEAAALAFLTHEVNTH
jgi:hypothetical protein